MVNVHALGGRRMLEAARAAMSNVSKPPLLIAVTILTSMGEQDISEIGLQGTPADNVARLADLASDAGLDGVVCSPQEVMMLRKQLGDSFSLVTPGIRPSWSVQGDQRRITTPADAVRLGADYLVIGRPVTAAENPMAALERIELELNHQ
jgi:orotidine-5'-phosphate decarboxylase